MATSIRVSFAPRRTQRANRWPNIAPSSRGATSRPIDMPVPTIKICSSTCTMVCQTGISAPPTAFLTDGTVVVRVRSSHQITAAMEAPTVTEIARRMAGTLNGTGFMRILDVSKRETLDLVQHERQQARGRANGDADDGHRRNQRRNSADLRLLFLENLRLLRFPQFPTPLPHSRCTPSPSFQSISSMCPTCRNVRSLRPERGVSAVKYPTRNSVSASVHNSRFCMK